MIFATNSAGNAVTAPQRRGTWLGGFFQLGSPISRWFNADPTGRDAGWQAYLEYGLDAAMANDFKLAKGISATEGGGPIKGSLKGLTVFYKLNSYVQFGFEESLYQGQALPNTKGMYLHNQGRGAANLHIEVGGQSSVRYLASNAVFPAGWF